MAIWKFVDMLCVIVLSFRMSVVFSGRIMGTSLCGCGGDCERREEEEEEEFFLFEAVWRREEME